MKKIFLTIPFAISLTACNYFSNEAVQTENSSPKPNQQQKSQKVIVYNGEGNAKEIIKKETEDRGYTLNWHAKGRYDIQQNEIMAVKGLSFGEALIKLEEIFTMQNIIISEKAARKNLVLPHSEYLLMAVCGKELNIAEFEGKKYATVKKNLEDGLVANCTTPDKVFLTKDEMAKKAQQEAFFAQEKEMKAKQEEIIKQAQNRPTPDIDDGDETPIDIHDIDFGYNALTPEFIAQLEKETGQKFNPEIYMKNIEKKRAQARAQQQVKQK